MDSYNEDLAMAFLLPPVAKKDFQELSETLKSFFRNLGVRLAEVQLCPIGDAYVHFGIQSNVSGSWILSSLLVMATPCNL